MEEIQEPTVSGNPSYWTSVSIAGVIFGIVVFVISLISSYATINSEPSGSFLNPTQLIGTVGCLIGAFAGMLAAWHYAKEYDAVIKLGKGALIGFLTGAVIAVVNVLLSQIWSLVDPDMLQKVIDSTIANYEAMDLPDEQKQQMIDITAQSLRSANSLWRQLLMGIPLYGLLNLITGMIGAKVFGKKEEQF